MKHEKAKPKPPHIIIPLSDWAIELLTELHDLTGHTPFLFPSRDKPQERYISENTFGKLINDMGYKGIATPHGFRSLASSILNEHGFNPDAIEPQHCQRPNPICQHRSASQNRNRLRQFTRFGHCR